MKTKLNKITIDRAVLKQALDALRNNAGGMRIEGANNILREALAAQPVARPGAEPVLYIHPETLAMASAHVGAWKPGHELDGYIPLYTAPPQASQPAARPGAESVDPQFVYIRELCRALDAALDFAGTVGGGSSWWDEVWADHDKAVEAARCAASTAPPQASQPAQDAVDDLQGAANWLCTAIDRCDVADIQQRLSIGYNRARRLLDAGIGAAQKGKP